KGLYLLEAMACGIPVVQPPHGAFPEIIARTGGGLLAESEAPADLATRLTEIWYEPSRAREIGVRGRAGVMAHYSVARMADAVLDAYQTAILCSMNACCKSPA